MVNTRVIAILLFFIIFTGSLYAQIQITSSDNNQFIFSWHLENYRVDPYLNNGKIYSSIFFSGSNTVLGGKGEPLVPAVSVDLGIPLTGEIQIAFTPLEITTTALQYPLIKNNASFDHMEKISYLNQWITRPNYTVTNYYRTAHFFLCPFTYDSVTNTHAVCTRGICIVKFPQSNSNGSVSSNQNSDYERMLSKTIRNYDVAKQWRIMPGLTKKTVRYYPLSSEQEVYRFKVGDGHSGVNEGTTWENRLIKIPGDTIIKVFGNVNIMKIKLYASSKGELPREIFENIPDGIIEIPMYREDVNKNGYVEKEDYLIAHVTGASDWCYDHENYFFKLDRYDDYRNYMLTISRIPSTDNQKFVAPTGNGDTLRSFEDRVLYRTPQYQYSGIKDGNSLNWVCTRLKNSMRPYTLELNLPDIDSAEPVQILIKNQGNGTYDAFLGDQMVYKRWVEQQNKIYLRGSRQLSIKNVSEYEEMFVELDSIKVTYKRQLTIGPSGYIEIFSPEETGLYFYDLSIHTNERIYIFSISDDEQTFSLIDTIRNYNNRRFVWVDSGGVGTRYVVCSENALVSIPQKNQTDAFKGEYIISDLRSSDNSTDYLIISNSAFLKAAQELADHKKKIGFSSPKIAVLDDIYNCFSGGDTDPAAVRNFITYVKSTWKSADKACYAVLIGNGHFDYKNITTREPVYMPLWYTGYKESVPGDDVYAQGFTTGTGDGISQLFIGRIPCKSETDAFAAVKKIKEIEDPSLADYGDWRNRTLLVADDDLQGYKADESNYNYPHFRASETINKIVVSNWPSMGFSKVYLYDYSWNSAGLKPEAARAIIDRINNGVAYVNFFGHGADQLWADERVLTPDEIQKLTNVGKYPVISSFSCSVGEFDKPGVMCLSVALVNMPDAGAIATVSSSRTTMAYMNEALANQFYTNLFDTTTAFSLGMALTKAKMTASGTSQTFLDSYSIMGDPSICLVKLAHRIRMRVLNEFDSEIDTLKALQQITVKGEILDNNGAVVSGCGSAGTTAFVQLGLFNPEDTVIHQSNVHPDSLVLYAVPGKPVFSRNVPVINGTFSSKIMIPKNLSFEEQGVKLTAYCWTQNENSAATGVVDNLLFHGTLTENFNQDKHGPAITVKPTYDFTGASNFPYNSSLILDTLKITIEVHDENGVDVDGTGPDEGLVMEISGAVMKKNINNKFQFKDGDYRTVIGSLRENNLTPGMYKMIITARDLIGNISSKSFNIEIVQDTVLQVRNVLNSPNPMRMGKTTRFFYYSTSTFHQTNATIKIFTLSGKPVRIIKNAVSGEVWDGRDQVGNLLSPDVYLYQITLYFSDLKKYATSKIGKLVIQPPHF